MRTFWLNLEITKNFFQKAVSFRNDIFWRRQKISIGPKKDHVFERFSGVANEFFRGWFIPKLTTS